MKWLLSAFLGLACVALIVSLFVIKRGAEAQHQSDADAIAGCSNQLTLAQTQIEFCHGTIALFSNRLDTCQSASLTFSNQLIEANSTIALGTEQVTNLNRQIAELESNNQALSQRVMDLTGQLTNQVAVRIASLTNQIAATQTRLDQANKEYALLENRFRRDVAERLVMERKFNNLTELKAQMEYLKWNPVWEVSSDRILEGLDVVVKSNLSYVITPE